MKYTTTAIRTAWECMIDRPTIEHGVDALLQELRGLRSTDVLKYDEEDIQAAWNRLRTVEAPIDANVLLEELAKPPEPEIADNLPVIDKKGYVWNHNITARNFWTGMGQDKCANLEVLIPATKVLELFKEAWDSHPIEGVDPRFLYGRFVDRITIYKREGK